MPAMGEQVRHILEARAQEIKDKITAIKGSPEIQKIKDDIDVLVTDVNAALTAARGQAMAQSQNVDPGANKT